MKNFLTVPEIARLENVSGVTVIRWIKKGVFPNTRRIGRNYRVTLIDYQKWHESTKIYTSAMERTNDRSDEHTNI